MFGIAVSIRPAVGIALSAILTSIATAHSVGCLVGDEVDAVWPGDGQKYRAAIHSINSDDTITVDFGKNFSWGTNSTGRRTSHRMHWDGVLRHGKVCSRPQECHVGDVVKALNIQGDKQERYKATIQSISGNGSMTVKWHHGTKWNGTTSQVAWNQVEKHHAVCAPSPDDWVPPGWVQPAPGTIVSSWSGKCLDLPFGDVTNGNYLWTWDCDGSDRQRWAWNDYAIHWDGGMVWTHCIDVPSADFTNANGIELWECLGAPQQQWSYDAATKSIVLGQGEKSKCIDLMNGGVTAGTPVQLWDCYDGTMNQMWDLGPSTAVQVI